jgi:hypothetical protein
VYECGVTAAVEESINMLRQNYWHSYYKVQNEKPSDGEAKISEIYDVDLDLDSLENPEKYPLIHH